MNPEEVVIKITQLEAQMGRLLSDYESEKGTRARQNTQLAERLDKIDAQQRKIERIIWMAGGALAVLQFLLKG